MEALTTLIGRGAHGYPSRVVDYARAKVPNGILGTHRADVIELDHVRRRDLLGGLIHEYQLAA